MKKPEIKKKARRRNTIREVRYYTGYIAVRPREREVLDSLPVAGVMGAARLVDDMMRAAR